MMCAATLIGDEAGQTELTLKKNVGLKQGRKVVVKVVISKSAVSWHAQSIARQLRRDRQGGV
jgi:hypothetical protein